MKKILLVFTLLMSFLFAEDATIKSIVDNVLKPNVDETIKALDELKKNHSKKEFQNFIFKWKELEASYIGGDLDENLIDHPRLIDVYHNINEDITSQLEKIVNSNDDYSYALYKNSHKSVNALEYLIFTEDKLSKSRKDQAIDIIIDNINSKLSDIKDTYTKKADEFINDDEWSYSIISNALISSIYKLKEWRIGEPSGLVAKYKDMPNNERAEYFLSKTSLIAAKGVLQSHIKLFTNQDYKNLYSYAVSKDYKEEANSIANNIIKAYTITQSITKEDFINNKKIKELYDILNQTQKEYQMLLILNLEIPMKIIEADGD